MMASKVCPKCKLEKELELGFYKGPTSSGYMSYCKVRVAEISRKTKARVTDEEYDEMLASQGGGCAICGGADPGRKSGRFCVDHDHATDETRGLLCHNCNLALGLFKDDSDVLHRAHAYLLHYGEMT